MIFTQSLARKITVLPPWMKISQIKNYEDHHETRNRLAGQISHNCLRNSVCQELFSRNSIPGTVFARNSILGTVFARNSIPGTVFARNSILGTPFLLTDEY